MPLAYQALTEADWTLEVEDFQGGSTVWSHTFSSDQAALAEVIRMIAAEGFLTFLVGPGQLTVH